ncbi:putative F-box protein At1g50870 [Lolium perenne]|uniref:putative F-box protein At1g50870 n=1 Tax=Lolium perenne TaxID=4522 RepID=UPI003A99DDAD
MAPTLHPARLRSSTPPIVATSNDGVLPLELLLDILLRLPTESICRFRAVCRSWRSLLCHPDLIAAAQNPGPLLAAAVSDSLLLYWSCESTILNIENGDEVKRLSGWCSWSSGDCSLDSMIHERVVCVTRKDQPIGLVDPLSGDICVLPDHKPAPDAFTWCTIGCAATGEYKVLVVTATPAMSSEVCKILTLNGGDHSWRETGSPPFRVLKWWIGLGFPIINGIAYILGYIACAAHQMIIESNLDCEACEEKKMIMEFDLDCEEWRPNFLQGPLDLFIITLADLQGHLVAVFENDDDTTVELWFLVDSKLSIWSKRYTITMTYHHTPSSAWYFDKPLAVLEDGRIVMSMMLVPYPEMSTLVSNSTIDNARDRFLRIYDPTTKSFSDGEIVPNCNHITVFTWSLLHTGPRGALDRVARLALISRRQH